MSSRVARIVFALALMLSISVPAAGPAAAWTSVGNLSLGASCC